jgi:hypothetical protein
MDMSKMITFMAGTLFILGTISMCFGLFTLITKVIWGDLKTIAQQTAQLAQKGITEEVAGLVGNASNLIAALNKLVATAAGIGVFLFLFGGGMIVLSYFLAMKAL